MILQPPTTKLLLLLVTAMTSLATVTVVQKCTATHTLELRTNAPIKDVVRALNGSVSAAATLMLPARDTTIRHDPLLTTHTGSGASLARVATFRDSTFAGVVDAVITAPPDSAPLAVRYKISRPEFAPRLAFVESGDKTVAVVSWRGEQVQLRAVVPPPRSSPRVFRYVGAEYSMLTNSVTAVAGLGVRIGAGFDASAQLSHSFSDGPALVPTVALRKIL